MVLVGSITSGNGGAVSAEIANAKANENQQPPPTPSRLRSELAYRMITKSDTEQIVDPPDELPIPLTTVSSSISSDTFTNEETNELELLSLLFESQHMSEEDRVEKLSERYGSNDDILESEFMEIVINRVTPAKRESFLAYESRDKLRLMATYASEMERDFEDYLFELEHSSDLLLPDSLSLLRGRLEYVCTEEVASFLGEGQGVYYLLGIIDKHSGAENIWEIYHCCLECFEAILNTGNLNCVQYLLDNEASLYFITSNLDHADEVVRWCVLEMLLGLFFTISEQHPIDADRSLQWFQRLFAAMLLYAENQEESSVWWILVEELNKELSKPDEFTIHSLDHCGNVVYLVNQMLMNPNLLLMERFEAHSNLRYLDFPGAIQEILTHVGEREDLNDKIAELANQFEIYEQLELEDRDRMPDSEECFHFVQERAQINDAGEHFNVILQCLATIPDDCIGIWMEIADAVESIAIHGSELVEARDEYEIEQIRDEQFEIAQAETEQVLSSLRRKVVELKEENVALEEKIQAEVTAKLKAESDGLRDEIKKLTDEGEDLKKKISDLEIKLAAVPISAENIADHPKPVLDPALEKYYKMLKLRIPKNAVINKMKQDKIDPSRINEIENFMNGKASVATPVAAPATSAAPKLDPALEKYAKMLKMRVPKPAVMNKMKRDKIDPARISEVEDFLNGKSSRPAPQIEKVPTNDSPQPTIAEELKKYARMLKMKVPKPAILVQMRKDKIDESRIDEVEAFVSGKPFVQKKSSPPKAEKPELPEELKKFARMMKMKVPRNAILVQMRKDKIDESRMNEIEAFVSGKPMVTSSTAEKKELPDELKKYAKMLKMKVPRPAVLNKMKRDKIDASRIKEVEIFLFGKATEEPGKKATKTKKNMKELDKYVMMLLTQVPQDKVEEEMEKDGVSTKRIHDCLAYMDGKKVMKDKAIVKQRQRKADETWKNSKFFNQIKAIDHTSFLNLEDLDSFKEKPKPKKKKKEKKKKQAKKKKPKKVCLIEDFKVLQKMTFMCANLKRQKLTNEQIVEAFWNLDSEKIDIQAFLQVLPTDEVMQFLRQRKDIEPSSLDAPSLLYYDLRHIPLIKQRTTHWLFAEYFDEEEANLKMQMDLVQHVVDDIHHSEGLKLMFSAIMKLLQTTSNWKYVHGFPLEAIYIVSKKHCIDGSSWMMKLCSLAEARKPGLLDFIKTLKEGISSAQKYRDISGMERKIKKLVFGMKKIENAIKKYKVGDDLISEDCTDRFVDYMQAFLKRAQKDVHLLEDGIKKLDESCKNLARDFGMKEVTEKKETNTDYLPQIMNFVKYVEDAMIQNEKLKEQKKKEERKAKEKARRQKLKLKKAQEKLKSLQDFGLDSCQPTLTKKRSTRNVGLHTLAKKQLTMLRQNNTNSPKNIRRGIKEMSFTSASDVLGINQGYATFSRNVPRRGIKSRDSIDFSDSTTLDLVSGGYPIKSSMLPPVNSDAEQPPNAGPMKAQENADMATIDISSLHRKTSSKNSKGVLKEFADRQLNNSHTLSINKRSRRPRSIGGMFFAEESMSKMESPGSSGSHLLTKSKTLGRKHGHRTRAFNRSKGATCMRQVSSPDSSYSSVKQSAATMGVRRPLQNHRPLQTLEFQVHE